MVVGRLVLGLVLAGGVAACSSKASPSEKLPRVELSTVQFDVASGFFTRVDDGGLPAGWLGIATNSPDTCALVGRDSLPEGVSYLSVEIGGEVDGECVIGDSEEESAPACRAVVFVARQGSGDRPYKTLARDGRVKATLKADGTMAWDIQATFLRNEVQATSCDGGGAPGGEATGVWTCVTVDGVTSECEGDCFDSPCCNQGRAETETLSVSFDTPGCDSSGGAGGSGGTGGDTSCTTVCAAIRECSDPDTKARCLADCASQMEESCRSCYTTFDCEVDTCAAACPGLRCWSDFECNRATEFCDVEAAEPRCVSSSGGHGGAGGGGGT
jgi:hypothetical protein